MLAIQLGCLRFLPCLVSKTFAFHGAKGSLEIQIFYSEESRKIPPCVSMAGFLWFVWAKKKLSKPILPYGGWPNSFFFILRWQDILNENAYFRGPRKTPWFCEEEEAFGLNGSISLLFR